MAPGERWLLCSDGLHDVIDLEQIKAILALPALHAASEFLALVLSLGAPDNTSFLIGDTVAG